MSSFTPRQEQTLGKILRRWGETQIEPLDVRAQALERRIVELEMRDLDNPMGAAQYSAFCERVRAPLRLGAWSPSHSGWRK